MKNLLILFLVPFILSSCNEDKIDAQTNSCDSNAFIQSTNVDPVRDEYHLDTAYLEGDCIHVTYQYGGGCGDVQMSLAGIHSETEEYPPSLQALLTFSDKDNCEAYITKTESFNIKPFQKDGSSELSIHLVGHDKDFTFLYTY